MSEGSKTNRDDTALLVMDMHCPTLTTLASFCTYSLLAMIYVARTQSTLLLGTTQQVFEDCIMEVLQEVLRSAPKRFCPTLNLGREEALNIIRVQNG